MCLSKIGLVEKSTLTIFTLEIEEWNFQFGKGSTLAPAILVSRIQKGQLPHAFSDHVCLHVNAKTYVYDICFTAEILNISA